MAESAYIHIPFCTQKCKYCSFISFTTMDKMLGYIYSLLKEIDTNYAGEELKTLYFGGGTPSLINPSYLNKIINKFRLSNNCELTLEMNPDDVSEDYLRNLIDIGVNRLSIGSQTFDDEVLYYIGRRHNSRQTIEAVKLAQKVGFKNISLDLIYGLPNTDLNRDLEIITSLGVQHISTYGLKIEENSYFYKHFPKNLPDDDSQADMYIEINKTLNNLGYNRYEISNFSYKGFESKHNLNYWNNSEYYGFGVAAHGYIDGIRYNNVETLEKYLDNPTSHKNGHIVTNQEKLEEEIFLGFRKENGINIFEINQKFNIDFEEKYKKVIEKYQSKYLIKEKNNYKLTIEGILLSNNILCDFCEVLD